MPLCESPKCTVLCPRVYIRLQFSPDRLVEIASTRMPEQYGDFAPSGLERLLNQVGALDVPSDLKRCRYCFACGNRRFNFAVGADSDADGRYCFSCGNRRCSLAVGVQTRMLTTQRYCYLDMCLGLPEYTYVWLSRCCWFSTLTFPPCR